MNINSKDIFIDLHLTKSNNAKQSLSNEINKRISSLTKAISNRCFSDLDEIAMHDYFSKKKSQINNNTPHSIPKSKQSTIQHNNEKKPSPKRLHYYLKGAPNKIFLNKMFNRPSLLTTELSVKKSRSINTPSIILSTPRRLLSNSPHSVSGFSSVLESNNKSQRSKTAAKTVKKSRSDLTISKRRRMTDSSMNDSDAMVFSPIFSPLKRKHLLKKRIDFYAQFNLFKRKPNEMNINRKSLIQQTTTLGDKQRLNSFETLKMIQDLISQPIERKYSDEDNNDNTKKHIKLITKINKSSFSLPLFKFKEQKAAMKQIESLIDYSDAKRNYEVEQIEKIQRNNRMLLLSKINNNLITKNFHI